MKLLLIDGNSIINRAYHAMKYARLTDSKGNDTGAVYGFFNILLRQLKLGKKEAPTHVITAFDVKSPTFRHLIYPEYKGKRAPQDEALTNQFPIVKELLRAMGIAVIEKAGLEADDIIGTIAKQCGRRTTVLSGDRDLLQLVDKNVSVIFADGKNDTEYTEDNILELFGLSPQGVVEYKGLSGDSSDNIVGVPGIGDKTARELLSLYGSLEGIYEHIEEIKGSKKDKLIAGKESAFFSRRLATIKTDAELEYNLDSACLAPFSAEAYAKMKELGFGEKIIEGYFPSGIPVNALNIKEVATVTPTDYSEISDLLQNIEKTGRMALIISDGYIDLAYDELTNYKIKIFSEDFFTTALDEDRVYAILSEALQSNRIRKIIFDLKAAFYRTGMVFEADDLTLMNYVVDAGRIFDSAKELLEGYGAYGDALATNAFNVEKLLTEKMKAIEVESVYREIELPLVPVLYAMEKEGVKIDRVKLAELKEVFTARTEEMEGQIHALAGENFNVNSPKQLSTVLFEKLGLPFGGSKKSTAQDVLNKLHDYHPIVPLITEYRTIKKMLSTYVSSYDGIVDKNGRLHTIFKQTVTTTGRLSSAEPNLQNIPIRKPEGRVMRGIFVASEGQTLVAADYSQIELRLLAHFSGDEELIAAYRMGEDIHAQTAAKIYGVDLLEVTHDMRAAAKTINFGIIYGMSVFGLSEALKVPIPTAKDFHERYFRSYPSIRAYLDDSVEIAKERGYTRTLFGRIRYIPELKSQNKNLAQAGERMAKNMPLQGTSADIIKIAMLRVYNALQREKLKARLVLQVHDELLVDTPQNEVERVKVILKREMENAATLKVPLVADVGVGYSWLEAK